jgi:hypothetical protein
VSENLFFYMWRCLGAGNLDWKAEPFDFLIDGELVRMSLEKFLLAKGISAVLVFPFFHFCYCKVDGSFCF